jgi:hypothetical protein
MILSANQQTVVCPSLPSLLKRDLAVNPNHFSRRHNLFFLLAISVSSLVLIPCLSKALAMAASHPHLFQSSVADESEIRKLVVNHFLPDHAVLQWCPATGEDLSTPNTNEIMVFFSFQCGFGLPACDFFHGLLDHYQIKLVHLNPNSILQIVVFFHLCEAFLGIPPNFPMFKNYFFLKYQPSAANRKVIGVVGLQICPRAVFLDFPLKTSLRGWHKTLFYCEKHEPSLPLLLVDSPSSKELGVKSQLHSNSHK